MTRPNFLFLHSHNTGQFVEPYGYAVPTPNLLRLAREGVLFRRAFAAAPTCSPSRAAFLSGMTPHSCGMLGLAHRGFAMADYDLHMARVMKANGYLTAMAGVEHTAPELNRIGYDLTLSRDDTNYPAAGDKLGAADAVTDFLRGRPREPFFVTMGLNETHRPFPTAEPAQHAAERANYALPMPPFPDNAITRQETADFKAAARIMDRSYGAVLSALDETGLAQNTWVFCFSDHGLQFPQHMCNLTDRGIAVYLIIRGPAGGTDGIGGGRVVDQMVSLIDLAPTVYTAASIPIPSPVEGKPLQQLLDGSNEEIHDEVFAEVNYHAAYEPMRAVRTDRFKYIRRFDRRTQLVLPNVDDTPSKQFLLDNDWLGQPREQEMLYDLLFDPHESQNLIGHPKYAPQLSDLRHRLNRWMLETDDPLLRNSVVPAPSGSKINDPDGRSPKEPPIEVQ